MSMKLSPVALAIIAALLCCAPILALNMYADATPVMTPAIALQR